METIGNYLTQKEACDIVGVSSVTMWRIAKLCGLTVAWRGRNKLLDRSQISRVAQLKKQTPGAAITPELFWKGNT